VTLNRSPFTPTRAEVNKKIQTSVNTEIALVVAYRADTIYSVLICKCNGIMRLFLTSHPESALVIMPYCISFSGHSFDVSNRTQIK
jgi:hypothetical protein